MPDEAGLDDSELERRIADVQSRMRPVELELGQLRVERDLLLTERRRRERLASRENRASLKASFKEGRFPTVGELVATSDSGSLDGYVFHLKTGGEVRLGFPGAKAQTLSFTDGAHTRQARDLGEAAQIYAEGWELGSPGRPGVRVHFVGTRQERLVGADEVFARALDRPA